MNHVDLTAQRRGMRGDLFSFNSLDMLPRDVFLPAAYAAGLLGRLAADLHDDAALTKRPWSIIPRPVASRDLIRRPTYLKVNR